MKYFHRTILALLVFGLGLASALQTEESSVVAMTKDLKNNTTALNSTLKSFSESGRSMGEIDKKEEKRGRGGRMLDLDHLAGDIGKDEKLARERSITGQRQSRILSDDSVIGTESAKDATIDGRSKKSKSSQKKMSIKGFIPIISLDSAKEGKHYDNPLDAISGSNESSDDDEDEQQEGDQNQAQVNREQLISSYGGQTSAGHASFGLPHMAQSEQSQASQQWQPSVQNPQQDDQSEIARSKRKLMGSGGILAGPKRFVSSLVPNQPMLHTAPSQPMLSGPSNMPVGQPGQDCLCVPFFQCKNGYLSEGQLSKAQLQQLASYQRQQPRIAPHDLKYAPTLQQQQPMSSLMSQLGASRPLSQPGADQQQMVNDIYEQLRKNIESENLEQQLQLQQQQPAAMYQPLDERSKSGSNATDDLMERSLLNSLGRRAGSAGLLAQRSCGIMRTCCKIPPLVGQYPPMANGRLVGPQMMPQTLARPIPARPDYQLAQAANHLPQVQQGNFMPMNQDIQPHSDYLTPSSAQTLVGPSTEVAQQRPQGVFMGGRCGVRTAFGIAGRVQNNQPAPGTETQAEFGEFPAHAAILKRLSPGDSLFVCSAVLVSNQWLATAAHCVRKLRPEELKVRLGEWDVSRDDEFYPFVETNVRDILIHPEFQPSSLVNDIALLRLESPVDAQQMPHVAPACLASQADLASASAGQRCWVAGWGKDAFGTSGAFQSVLRKVDLPVVGRQECENALRYQTKLGRFFRLHASAICAGGERGKDACEGDGGAGLYCIDPETGLTKVLGLVSWGIGCGQRGVPGVYTNLAYLQAWIENTIAGSGEENLYQLTDRSNNLPEGYFKSIINERSNGPLAANATESSSQPRQASSEDSSKQPDEASVESRAG